MICTYRAWHKENKTMHEVLAIDFTIEQISIRNTVVTTADGHTYEAVRVYEPISNFEIMQSTGLTDKNGVEIFEGDLLRNPIEHDWGKENYVCFEVYFHDNDYADEHIGFQMNRLHFQGSFCAYSMREKFLPKYTSKFEVIGNIYQNPELLK